MIMFGGGQNPSRKASLFRGQHSAALQLMSRVNTYLPLDNIFFSHRPFISCLAVLSNIRVFRIFLGMVVAKYYENNCVTKSVCGDTIGNCFLLNDYNSNVPVYDYDKKTKIMNKGR